MMGELMSNTQSSAQRMFLLLWDINDFRKVFDTEAKNHFVEALIRQMDIYEDFHGKIATLK